MSALLKFLPLPLIAILIANPAGAEDRPGPAYPTGLLPPSEEEKAWLEERARWVTFPEKDLEDLPSRVVNLEHLPPVGQQSVGSCASWSIVYYVKGWQEAKEHGVTRPFPGEHILSPAFVYYYVGISASGGSTFEANVEFLERHGTSTFEEYPESRYLLDQAPPPVEVWKSAARRRSAPDSLGRIPTSTEAGLTTLKAVLASGELASAGVGVWSNFVAYPAPGEGVDNNVFFAEGTAGWGGLHALTIIGYDDDIPYHNGVELRSGAFLAVNSWGTNWGVAAEQDGERGYIWLAYEYFLNNIGAPRQFDFYTIENLIGYEPRHFLILDLYHPRRVEIALKFLGGPRDQGTPESIFINRGTRPVDMRFAVDVTDLVSDEDEVFWLSIFDIVMQGPGYGPRPPSVIREFTVEQAGRPPLSAVDDIPFWPVDQLSQVWKKPEWLVVSPTRRHEEVFPSGMRGASADVADVFGEGSIDIVTSGRILRMAGNRLTPEGSVPIGQVALGDFDNDGLPDLAVWGEFNELRSLRIYRNEGAGRFKEEPVFLPLRGSCSGLFWVDFTGDGRLDLLAVSGTVYPSREAETRLFVNRGGGMFRDSGLRFPLTRPPNKIVDFDQDGLMDFGGFRNLGNGQWAPPPWDPNAAIAWGDYNGNGLLDAAVLGSYNISVWRNDGGGQFTFVVGNLPGPEGGHSLVQWADVNNSGRLDLIAKGNLSSSGSVSTESETMVFLQQEDGSFRKSGLAIHGNGMSGTLVLADFDGDGDVDFLTGGYPSMEGTTFYASVEYEVRYTESRYADADGRAIPNQRPSPPGNLSAHAGTVPGTVTLRWDDAMDDRTPPRAMRYQLRVGTAPGGHQVVSAAQSLADLPVRRLSPEQAGQALHGLAAGQYYWSVRAVDAAGAFSPWAPERSFAILEGVKPTPIFDPNQDGVLDAADIAAIHQLLGSTLPTDLLLADIDGSGDITEHDMVALARLLAARPGALTPPWMALMDHRGGELRLGEARVTVPPGAIVGDPEIMRLEIAPSVRFAFEFWDHRDLNHPYRLSGIPYDLAKPIEVSLRNSGWSAEDWQELHIAIGEEGYAPSTGTLQKRHVIVEPDHRTEDTIHFLIEPLPLEARKGLRSDFVEGTYSTDFFGLGGYSSYTTPNFRIAFPRSYDTEVVENLANDLEHAHARYRQPDMGFSYAARTRWPLDVTLKRLKPGEYGNAYGSIRGDNHGGIELSTDKMADPSDRRVTAFHEFFHIVEAFYDPRTSYWKAKSIAPHYTLSEMVATWIEELAVPDPANYVPEVWRGSSTAPFSESGWELPSSVTYWSSNQPVVAAHGYGWAPAIRYLVRQHGLGVVRITYENVKAGQNWVEAIGNATGDSSFRWFHHFVADYVLGRIYPLEDAAIIGIVGPARLRIAPTQDMARFTGELPNLSARLFGVWVSSEAPPGTIKPEHRLGFRLEGPFESHMSVISQVRDESRDFVDMAAWDSGVSRLLTGSVHPVLSKPSSAYIAVVTSDKASPRYADPEEFSLSIALLEDQTLVIPPSTFSGHSLGDSHFPPMESPGGTVMIPAASHFQAYPLPGTPGRILTGALWEDPGNNFEVSLSIAITETQRDRPDLNEVWHSTGIERYTISLMERHGPTDLVVVQTFTSADGTFTFPGHFHEGRYEWNMTAHYTVSVTNTVTNTTVYQEEHWVPLVVLMADGI